MLPPYLHFFRVILWVFPAAAVSKDSGRVRGCPVSVADHIHYLSLLGRIKNANFLPYLVVPINVAYVKMRLSRAFPPQDFRMNGSMEEKTVCMNTSK